MSGYEITLLAGVAGLILAALGSLGRIERGSDSDRALSQRVQVYAIFFLMASAVAGLSYLLVQSAPVFHP